MRLSATGLVKRYPGVVALNGIDFDVHGGEVHVVAGENGAGKSTLMQILSGAVQPDSGAVYVDDVPVTFRSPRDARTNGIRMIHQELNLVAGMSVAENILLGAEPSRLGIVDRRDLRARARAVLDRLGQPTLDVDDKVRHLSLAARQMTEIAKAVAGDAGIVVMDEPTAILTHDETEALFRVIGQLREAGTGIVYISHRMDDIFRIADRVTVLRDGALVDSRPLAKLTRGDVVRSMIGRDLTGVFPVAASERGTEMLRLERVSSGVVRDASLSLHSGEIVGVVGLVGSGRTELAHAIYGAARTTAGRMLLDGAAYAPRSPRDAISRGIALLPEDRKRQGLILAAAIRENVSLVSLRSIARGGIIDRAREDRSVSEWTTRLDVRAPSIEKRAGELSGGNQQKVVLARWMLANARVLLFDEPTRGIDVGAKAEIHELMRNLADRGAAVMVISSDLPEALGISDRVIVMRNGTIVADLTRAESLPERVAALVLGETSSAVA